MDVRCAQCTSYVCRGGNREAGPEFCPMHGPFPEFHELYPEEDSRDLLLNAARVEAAGYGRWTRLREVSELAHRMGFSRVGIAHALDMAWEAGEVASHLRRAGLEPILPPTGNRCDPLGQADFFFRKNTQMNVVAGMRVAGESLFIKASHAPTVCLIARDARLHHNPAAALYTSRSYSQDEVHGHWPPEEREEPRGPADLLEKLSGKLGGTTSGSRLAEVMDVVHGTGGNHIGISFCVGFKEEAKILTRILEVNGFTVSSACCKTGATPKREIGVRDDEQIRPGRPEMTCNPVAQAELLNRDGIHFGLVLGQCVGHDAATFQKLEAPAVCLVAKDRVLGHNPVAALY